MSQEDFLASIAARLEQLNIAFMVAGSHTSSFYGQPRATNEVDLVIDLTAEQLDKLVTLLSERYYVSLESAREAFHRRSMFNVIDFTRGWKADLIVRKNRSFSEEEFNRRQTVPLYGQPTPVASPEDVILSKLEWNKSTPSERQVKDALNVAVVQWPRLDQDYLRKWAQDLDLTDQLEELLRTAAELQIPQNPASSLPYFA